jgi:hypothetical protein
LPQVLVQVVQAPGVHWLLLCHFYY